jgi:hypothetical protein
MGGKMAIFYYRLALKTIRWNWLYFKYMRVYNSWLDFMQPKTVEYDASLITPEFRRHVEKEVGMDKYLDAAFDAYMESRELEE